MMRLYLLLNLVGRTSFFGFIFGTILGLIGGTIFGFMSLSGILTGLFAGAISGILLGGLNGIAFTIVTLLLYRKINNVRDYRLASLITGIVVTLVVSRFWFAGVLQIYSETGTISQAVLIALVLISTVVAGFGSQRIATEIFDATRPASEQPPV